LDFTGKVLLQLFNKRKLKNGTKTYLEQKIFSIIVKFKKLRFSAPLKEFRMLRIKNRKLVLDLNGTVLKKKILAMSTIKIKIADTANN